MKKKGVYIFILTIFMLIIVAALLFVFNYVKYDDVNYMKVTFEKDLDNETYVISILIPNYFEKKLEYELINKLEENLKNETDPEKKRLIERRLQTDTYYYGYDDFYEESSPPINCAAYVRSIEKKSTDKKPERDLEFFLDYYKGENYKTVDINAFSYKFGTIVIKKSCFDNAYYIHFENEKYVLEIYTSLAHDADEKEESEYLKNLIKAVDVQKKIN